MRSLFPRTAEVAGAARRAGLRLAQRRSLMLRASVAGIVFASLPLAAFAAPAGAKVSEQGGQAAGRALAVAAPGSGWSVVPSPNPRAGNGSLNAVSCATASACTAVGLHVRESGLGVTLAERRGSAGAWTVQSTPNPPGAASSALDGVSCPSRSACTGVGQFFVASGAQLTLAERWNGTTWAIQPTPNPAGSSSNSLSAVACPAADSCTAVGRSASNLLVEQWHGSGWRIQPAPVPSGAQFSELNGVSCTATSCLAVGDYVTGSGADVTLAERWNGTTWAIQPTLNPPAAHSFSFLAGVSCTSLGACEAVGGSDAGDFAERWNGSRWSLQAVPAPAGSQQAVLYNVACAAVACEAAGTYQDSSGAFVTLGEGWNGAAWQAQPTPNPARASTNDLAGVSCPSPSDCTAVGQGNGDGTPVTLAEQWQNGRWNLQTVPSPIGAAENVLNGIACPATNACEAVGTAGPTRGVVAAEALRWNGTAWQLQQVPPLPGTGLDAVSCVTETECVAVGGPGSGALAERWDGTDWTVLPTPKPAGAPQAGFNAVSCAAVSSCMATGGYMDATGDIHLLAERWNGHTWSVVPAPTPSSQPSGFFTGVACSAPAACIGVGASFDASGNSTGTFAERWDGTSWTLQPTPTQHTPGSVLGSVWCASMTACIATGSTNAGTLAEQLTGTSWSVLPTPNPPGTQGDLLSSVSCTSLSACTGAGLAFASSGSPQTLAERWNGAHWHIQPTPLLPGVHDLGISVACLGPSACVAAGGFENDGPGAKTITEQWQGNGIPAAQTAPAAYSPPAYRGILACIRAAIGKGFASGVAPKPIGSLIRAPMPQRSQPGSEIEQIASLCHVA